jgi:hypothetical protein
MHAEGGVFVGKRRRNDGGRSGGGRSGQAEGWGGVRREVAVASDRGRSLARAASKFGGFFPPCSFVDGFRIMDAVPADAGACARRPRIFVGARGAVRAAMRPAGLRASLPSRSGTIASPTVRPP